MNKISQKSVVGICGEEIDTFFYLKKKKAFMSETKDLEGDDVGH